MHISLSAPFSRLLTISAIFFTTGFASGAVLANPELQISTGKLYVNVKSSNISLREAFTLIEAQTSLYFSYDENQVDLSQKLILRTGQFSVSDLLKTIAGQTGYKFAQVKRSILVSAAIPALPKPDTDPSPPPVKGVVKDAAGAPLPGATIMVKGTNTSVQSDAIGRFSINAPANAILVISYIGYKTLELEVAGRLELTASLEEIKKGLNEIVVMGYQSQRRSAISGAVTVVNVDNVSKIPVGFADQALQGQASGVRVTQATGQPGDGVAVRIRGVGSINNNDPLFIIDGVPTTDGINFLASDDIASITVLKDASSAAIYGARSTNGVVVITTKSGKSGKAQINYSGYMGVQKHGFLTPMTNAQDYLTLFNEMTTNDNTGLDVNSPLIKKPIANTVPMANTNWLKAIFQNAPMQNHDLSIGGGNEKTQYFISANAFNQDGIILNSWYKRYSLRTKITTEVSDRLKIGSSLNISYSNKNSIGSSGDGYGGNGGSVVRYALFRDPAIPVYNPDGSYSDKPSFPNFFGDGYNPVGLAKYTSNIEDQFRVFGNAFAEYKILDHLILKSDFGGDVLITDGKTFDRNWGTDNRINSPSTLTEGHTTNENFIWNNTIRYNKTIHGLHTLNILAGTEAVGNSTHFQTTTTRNFPNQDPLFQYLNLDSNIYNISVGESLNQWALLSFLGSVNYNYNNEYFLTGNARRDGSSKLDPRERWGNFFSGSVAWNLMKEDFVANLSPLLSRLKIRGSYGQLGNQNGISDYPYASQVSNTNNYVLGNIPSSVQGYTVSQLGFPKVKWETSTQADAGIDLGILEDKLTLSVDYFNKVTSDMLVQVPLPLIGGGALPPYQNNGSVQNRGFEFDLQYRNNDHKLKYSFSANLATIQNKVLSLANGTPIQGGRIDNGIYATLTAVGHPIGSFYGYQTEGIFQNANDIFTHAYQGPPASSVYGGIRPGDVKYKDMNGDGVIDQNDRTFLGSAIPKFTYGFSSNVSYGNFDLFVLFQGSYGNKIYMQVNQDIEGFYRPFNITQRVFDTRWHGEGTSNTTPLMSWADAGNNIKEASSRFLFDASYVRLKDVQLAYNIPKTVVNRLHVKGVRLYLSANNLVTITKYPGLDPEMHTSNNVKVEKYPADAAAGIDWGTYPAAKSFIFGANVNF
jgi:TonB-linked SusC/RagA family outer membrane protein